jgi:hypothetical protein
MYFTADGPVRVWWRKRSDDARGFLPDGCRVQSPVYGEARTVTQSELVGTAAEAVLSKARALCYGENFGQHEASCSVETDEGCSCYLAELSIAVADFDAARSLEGAQ